jgi:hypothetical protein
MLLRDLHILRNLNLWPCRLFLSAIEVVKTPKSKTDDIEKGKGKIENGTSSFVENKSAHAAETESWPHKHRPQSMDEIIGNQSIVTSSKPNLLNFTVIFNLL